MKRILLIASAIAGMFLTAACQQELYEPETNGTVTYEITLPAQMQTKGSTGYDKYDLYYEVYRQKEDGTLALLIDKVAEDVQSPVKLPLELLNNQTYKVLFWANKAGAKDANGNPYFNTENLQNVTMNPCASNDDNRDAFCGVDDIVVFDKAQTAEVTLKRPFAQVNIATLVKTEAQLGFNSALSTSKVTFASIPNTFNVLEDEPVEGSSEFIFDAADVPGGKFDNTDYTYAALNYIFVGNEKDLVSLTYEITTASGKVTKTIDNVPVQQNYRTNIVGNLLTSGAQYTITVEPGFVTPNGEYTVIPVQDANGLQEAIENAGQGDEIKFEDNIDLNDLIKMTRAAETQPVSLTIPKGKTITLNLNGFTLTQTVEQTGAYALIQNNGTLTITDSKGNGKISYGDTGNGGNYGSNTILNNGTMTIEGGIIENISSDAVYSNGFPHPVDNNGVLTINGGTLTNNGKYSSMRIWCTTDDNTIVTINGGTFEGSIDFQTPNASANKGSLTINGGTFNADTYTKCAVRLLGFGADVDEMVGYINGGVFNGEIALRNWSGSELNSQVFFISGGEFSSLAPMAYLAEGGVFKLNKDVAMTEGIKFNGVGTLDLNGKTVTGTDNSEKSFGLITNTGTLTVKNGTMVLNATVNREWNAYSSVLSNSVGGKLTVENATIQHLGGTDMAYGIDNLTNGKGTYAETVVEEGAVIKSVYRAIRMFLNGVEATNELYVNEGAVVEGANKSIWMQDPSKNANTGKLVVNEGAQLKGDAYLSVTAGSTEWPVYVSIADSALQDESTVLTSNVPALYDVVLKDGFWTIESSFSLATFVEAVIAAEGNYDGHGQTIKIIPVSGRSDNTNGCLVPNRLQKYGNPDVYYAQYQRFAELENVNISNVNFVFVPSAITVEDAWNTAGATTTAENVNGELQFMNAGSVTLTNCTFDKVAVSPINAATLTVNDCQFDGLNAYAIKDIKAKNVSIINTEFDNCNGGFWFNAAPASLIVTGNTFTTVGRRGAIQFSANGDYSNTTLNIAGNEVVGEGAFLWQLNKTITGTQIKPVSENNEYTTLYVDGSVIPADIAKIGDKIYTSLSAAVEAVKDGETIMLIADEIFTETNRCNNGGWWDGLAYSGDKSFTIDLGGYTIKQDGSLNDYLIWIKNDGAKANTITFKNGTMDAGTTAYCAIATASSNAQKITLNLEDINLINNISNGAVVKARGGSELNVKAGTVITGMNSYTGIEAAGTNTVVNVYEGAEIYQNGTSSYVGAIAGASQNATLNIYGGKGESAKCGIIVMSTGAVVNVSGGEWTANGNGTVAGGNQAVLVSQNNRYETSWARKSILNVTGGTFNGGYDCWGSGPGQEPDDAQINIKGGNFNADPATYVAAGYEAKVNAGIYTVDKAEALKKLEDALANGGNITLTEDVTLLESIEITNKVNLDLNGKTITAPLFSAFEVKAGGELTVKNGKVVAYESTVRAIGGKVTVESGEYTSTGTALDTPATYRYSLDCREGGELIINGGTFKSNNGMINVGSTVTINGGKFENIVEKTMTRHFAYVSAPLTINDGEFYGKANSSAGGCFFCGAAASGDIQVKGGKFTSLWTTGSVNRIFEVYFGGTINVTGGLFNTNGGIATFVTENTDEATKAAYPYVAK